MPSARALRFNLLRFATEDFRFDPYRKQPSAFGGTSAGTRWTVQLNMCTDYNPQEYQPPKRIALSDARNTIIVMGQRARTGVEYKTKNVENITQINVETITQTDNNNKNQSTKNMAQRL